MLVIISPAKSLDYKTPAVTQDYTFPEMLDESEKLLVKLRKMKPQQLSELMGISASLGQLNYERFQTWHQPFTPENAKQAVLAFSGDVFQGLDAPSFSKEQLQKLQLKLRILSGLYGVLKPLDLMQPYRLEMGTKLKVQRSADLYAFWKKKITPKIEEAIAESGSNVLINLASNEYYKSIDTKKLNVEIVTPQFKDMKNGQYKMISFFAKKARGLMTRFIIENEIESIEELQAFDAEGYVFNPRLSKPGNPVFTRG
ncbi:peroxide stress protein YaaA [uncultured Draconibacterium sp.]|uniref:peroxide stress protein YaaA n=1 Tax=uncultured Draconibacterium sp. TaxID=1573823 RepID=UPI0025D5C366|nr:peroxide stress protein YaaA [uncultured Draconibacterium sp.]